MFSLCTECFLNFGIKETVNKICSDEKPVACSNCGSYVGKKVTAELANDLMRNFFVIGSIPPEIGGPAPVFEFNNRNFSQSVTFGTNIDHDLKLLSDFLARISHSTSASIAPKPSYH